MDINWAGVQIINVGWNSHPTALLQMFGYCLDRRQYLDVDLVAGGRHVKVHCLALMCASPFLKELIVSQPKKPDVIFLDDIPFEDVMTLIELIYKGETTLGEHQIASFLDTADFLQIQGIELTKKEIESASTLDSIEPSIQEEEEEEAPLDDQDCDEDMENSGESGSDSDESRYISFVPKPKGPLELNFDEEITFNKGESVGDQGNAALVQQEGPQHAHAQVEAEDGNVDVAANLPALPGPDQSLRRVGATSLKKKKGKRRSCLFCKLAFRGNKLRRHLVKQHKFTEDWQLDIITKRSP